MEPHAKHLRSDSMVHLLTERQLKTTDQPEASAHLSSISARSEDGIVLLDRNLRCQAWNSFIENLSFVWVRQLAGTPCLETSSLLKELGIEDELIMALQGNTITCPDTPYAVKTGEAICLAPVCSPLRNAEGQICGVMVLLRNVTENKRLSETLLRGEVGPREARSQVKKGGWQWDIKTDAITWSDELYRIAGRQPKTAVPAFREHSCFYTSDSWWRLTTATLRVLQTGLPYQIELQLLRSDGSRRRVIGSGEAVRDTSGAILRLHGTIEDITESKWRVITREPELECAGNEDCRISSRLIQGQEEENARIGKDLRDNICQKISLLSVGIQKLSPEVTELPPQVQVRLDELWRHTTEIVAEIGQVSHQLYPSTLDLLGLARAIRRLCREFASRNGIRIACSCAEVPPGTHEKDVMLSVFRILEETLGNVARHSHASNVSVDLTCSTEELLLRVSDNGVGFEPEKIKAATGLGFMRMKERMRRIGGELAVWSAPMCGTRIEARVRRSEALPELSRPRGAGDYS